MSKIRRYECVACGHGQQQSTADFSAGHAPLCSQCQGVLRRVKGVPSVQATGTTERATTQAGTRGPAIATDRKIGVPIATGSKPGPRPPGFTSRRLQSLYDLMIRCFPATPGRKT